MQHSVTAQVEQRFFRALNAWVEPAVRRGFASPTLLPGALVVLESTGYKTGAARRTPLASLRIGRYRIVSTVRGERSFWVKNLVKKPEISYFLGGRRLEARTIVLVGGKEMTPAMSHSRFLQALVDLAKTLSVGGKAIVVLCPSGT